MWHETIRIRCRQTSWQAGGMRPDQMLVISAQFGLIQSTTKTIKMNKSIRWRLNNIRLATRVRSRSAWVKAYLGFGALNPHDSVRNGKRCVDGKWLTLPSALAAAIKKRNGGRLNFDVLNLDNVTKNCNRSEREMDNAAFPAQHPPDFHTASAA